MTALCHQAERVEDFCVDSAATVLAIKPTIIVAQSHLAKIARA